MSKIIKFCIETTGNKSQIIFYIFLSILYSLLILSYPLFTGLLINTVVYTQDFRLLLRYCSVIAIVSLLRLSISYFLQMNYNEIYINATHEISKSTINHIHNCPLSRVEQVDVANYSQRISQDAGIIVAFSITTLAGVFTSMLTMIIALVVILLISPLITVLISILLCIYLLLYLFLKKPLYNRGEQNREAQVAYFSKLYEQLQYTKFIKSHSLKELFVSRLESSYRKLRDSFIKYQKLNIAFRSLDNIILTAAQIFLYILGGVGVMQNMILVGSLVIAGNFFSKLINASSYFFTLGASYQNALVSFSRIREILSWEEEAVGTMYIENIYRISLIDVGFSYDEKNVLKKLNYEFTKGNIYAIIGNNGSGKSTIAQAILGLYPVESGDIRINNIPIKNVNMPHMRNGRLGYMEQNPVLLADSIERNMWLYSKNTIEKHSLLEKLNFLDFVEAHPLGWDREIMPSSNNLSGGEKQRIALARQIIKEGDVVIFDEPTSALDKDSIEIFVNYISEAKRDKIIILITHDRRLIEISDQTIRLD